MDKRVIILLVILALLGLAGYLMLTEKKTRTTTTFAGGGDTTQTTASGKVTTTLRTTRTTQPTQPTTILGATTTTTTLPSDANTTQATTSTTKHQTSDTTTTTAAGSDHQTTTSTTLTGTTTSTTHPGTTTTSTTCVGCSTSTTTTSSTSTTTRTTTTTSRTTTRTTTTTTRTTTRTTTTTKSTTTTTTPLSLEGLQLLPKDNIWNTRIDNVPVDARSDTYMASIGESPFLIYTETYYTVINNAQGIVPQYLTSITYLWTSDDIAYPIPNNIRMHPYDTDQELRIYNRDTDFYYYMWHARKAADGSWSADQANYHNMSSNEIRLGKALPVIQGEFRYDEVLSGSINHAIRATVRHTNASYVWPFFYWFENYRDSTYPPLGQRFRLKASVNISAFPPKSKAIAQAMKTYGIIVTDQHGPYTGIQIIGLYDSRWCSIYDESCDLHALYSLRNTDFEAVDTSSLMIRRDSMQARQI